METAESIRDEGLSVARFGDGEFNLMFRKHGINFQEYDAELSKELIDLAENMRHTKNGKLRLALPHALVNTRLDKPSVKFFWWNYTVKNGFALARAFNNNEYLDTNFSRTVSELSNHEYVRKHVELTKSIWAGRNVVIVEGKGTKFGVGNDLLDGALKVERIICPVINAFSVIDEIEKQVSNVSECLDNPLILLALGPTATVLAARFSNEGLQAVDIGHFDLQYEYLMKNRFKKIRIDGKYNNELINPLSTNVKKDNQYESEIFADVERGFE
ncbi:GT-D fold domain-containing glycosyltransferase [Furfurilactobacillus entadae]|uniref:GT-D fold domain-containing glycosyltransferase n=1 Tax=Furfurilactobacillus entadae TaxID=2922307 RepID=UPI0035F09B7E